MKWQDSGAGGPAVLFVHGWQADRSVWSGVIAALGAEVRTIAVDLPGSGNASTDPGPYTVERFAAGLRELLETLGVAPAVVVGHSMGAKVALRLTLDAPQMVRALVLIAPVPAGTPGFSPKGEAYLRATAGDPVAVRNWLARTLADPSSPALDELCAVAARTSREAALESFESWAHMDFAEETRSIETPALVIAPEYDAPEKCESNVAALLPNAKCAVLPQAAHYAIVERPQEVAALLRESLR